MKTLIFAASAAMLPYAALAHDGMAVTDAYARGANPKSGAAFMLLENHRKVDCTLSGVASDAAERVELHSNSEVDGVMKMAPIPDGITIPAEGEELLTRGGNHVMMMGLKAPLEDGQVIKMTLDFGECGTEEVEIPVDNQRSGDSAADDMDDHQHGHENH
ncbi:copper chaperone PCu(A)C [Paracoccus onubensis]|uniref:copper chaperone PCu(A)C n=1 Tax=Paracoccus onubensis TaxID=1675788 RepID=UPI0027303CC3|nr:copper chaperone PCu(A)C [Paracoccus onubensis]MDP0928365.1 copper chaperone PCu(A)C [Paracoccus onubensis]